MKKLKILKPVQLNWDKTKRLYSLCRVLDDQPDFANNSNWQELLNILVARQESIPVYDISGVIAEKQKLFSKGGNFTEAQDYFLLKTEDDNHNIYVFLDALYDYDENTKSSSSWELVKSMVVGENWEMEGDKLGGKRYSLRSCKKIG